MDGTKGFPCQFSRLYLVKAGKFSYPSVSQSQRKELSYFCYVKFFRLRCTLTDRLYRLYLFCRQALVIIAHPHILKRLFSLVFVNFVKMRGNSFLRYISRSAHRTPNFTNSEYFVCLLFEYFSR